MMVVRHVIHAKNFSQGHIFEILKSLSFFFLRCHIFINVVMLMYVETNSLNRISRSLD